MTPARSNFTHEFKNKSQHKTRLVSMGAVRACVVLTIYISAVSSANYHVPDLCVDLNQGVACSLPNKTFTNQRDFFSFLGLRYAKPPIGALRFQGPRRFFDWKPGGRIDASSSGAVCPQWDVETDEVVGDEDCLFVNVFVPSLSARGSAMSLLPVLVFVHGGGGFSAGGASVYGPELLMDQDLVLVTVQYRLGVFGFLSSQSRAAPGNYGLLDIIMALEWTRDNIGAFNGNPNHITLMGQGSGAAAVSLLVASPLTKGLFHKAILQSGSALCDWSVQEDARQPLRKMAAKIGCSVDESDENIVQCLRNEPQNALIKAQKELMVRGFFPVLFAPVVDGGLRAGAVLPASPESIYRDGGYNFVPMMVGETTHEGLTFFEGLQLSFGEDGPVGSVYRDCFVPDFLESVMDDGRIVDDVWKAIKSGYFRDVDFWKAAEVVPPLVEFLGDITVSSCVDKLLRAHSKSPVYYYVYAFRKYTNSQRNFLYQTEQKLNAPSDTELRSYFQGAAFHADDLSQLFVSHGSKSLPPPPPITDFDFTASMLCLFTGFITLQDFSQLDSWTCRNPLNPHFFVLRNGTSDKFRLPGLKSVEWPPFDRVKQQYLHLNSAFSLRSKYRHRERAMLDNLMRVSEEIVELREEVVSAKEPYHTVMWVLVCVCAVLALAVIGLLVARRSRSGTYDPNKGQ